jgi:hypothetical protein
MKFVDVVYTVRLLQVRQRFLWTWMQHEHAEPIRRVVGDDAQAIAERGGGWRLGDGDRGSDRDYVSSNRLSLSARGRGPGKEVKNDIDPTSFRMGWDRHDLDGPEKLTIR